MLKTEMCDFGFSSDVVGSPTTERNKECDSWLDAVVAAVMHRNLITLG